MNKINSLFYFNFILSLTIIIQCTSQNFTLVLLSQERGAACLDGSPAGLYIHQGKGQNKDNFVIFYDGGGFCGGQTLSQTLQECYQRSFTRTGTTKVATPTADLDRKGIIATDPQLNPIFYDWTKIYTIYCDGTQYFGNRSQPIQYKDQKLYFRGTPNILEQIKYLQDTYDIFNKNKIVVTGVSAGGIATFLYSNTFLARTKTAKIYSIPDSGLFLTDYFSPLTNQNRIRQKSRALLDIVWSQQKYPIEQCLEQWDNDVVQCFNAVNLVKYIKTPLLLLQSPYDAWSMGVILGVTCYSNKQAPYSIENCNQTVLDVINDYRDKTRQAFKKIKQLHPNTGFWAPSCIQHGFASWYSFNDPHFKVPGLTGKTMPQTILQFLENPDNPPSYIDTVNWPDNLGCNGLSNQMIKIKAQGFYSHKNQELKQNNNETKYLKQIEM